MREIIIIRIGTLADRQRHRVAGKYKVQLTRKRAEEENCSALEYCPRAVGEQGKKGIIIGRDTFSLMETLFFGAQHQRQIIVTLLRLLLLHLSLHLSQHLLHSPQFSFFFLKKQKYNEN